ncbi:hypothetical protein ACFW04_012209 [Cataglyphis niger]
MFIAILLLSMFILLLYYYYVHYGRNGRLLNLVPGPPGHPIIGNAIQFNVSVEEIWKLFISLFDKYYPIFKVWSCFIYCVCIRHPDDMEIILSSNKHIEKGYVYKLLHPWLGTGLLTSTETAMGISLQKYGEFQQQYRNAIHDIIKLMIYRLFKPWFHNDLIFALSPQGRKQKKILKILHGFTEKVIAERRLYHERTNYRYLENLENDKETEINDAEVFGIKKKRLAMLDLLIAISRDNLLSDLDIREEVDTFMFEGHDTTAMGITFALLLLAEHKDIQKRVRIEVENAMQESGGKLTMRSLQKLPYLERCLKEALRLYPSVFFIIRNIEEDLKLHSYVIPAKTMIFLNIYGVHRDPNFWSNPEVFDPDRFLPERIQKRHPYSYLPFSAGPRNCIGQRFGLLELKAMIAPLIYNFYLEPIDHLKDIRLKIDMIIRPSHPVYIKFIPIIRK